MQEEVSKFAQLSIATGGGAAPSPKPNKGETDPLGDKIGKIYVKTDRFMIYIADRSARDFGRLRLLLFALTYDECADLREKLCPTVGPITRITDMVCGMKPNRFVVWQAEAFESFTERCLTFMAKAMQMALEGNSDRASEMLEGLRQEVESRRDSANRMRYIFANAAALTAIVVAWAAAQFWGGADSGVIVAFFTASATAPVSLQLQYLDVLLFGALGAFFSVSIGLKDVRVNHSITLSEMLYAGFIRVPVGIIAAIVVIVLISGGWILNNLSDALRPWAYLLFGFIAGFSELFVPNALKQVETGTNVKPPDSRVIDTERPPT
ncbi:hypothetical protein [Pararhodobacter sp. SW119]|uniref:hypothetical protein n=1 Tax=Pararhodobacter sp. SW119 TaxID=2780075 RepID=UPI001ADF3487|nr:hypothetical protein [Pararhodobacter sp. SW119]